MLALRSCHSCLFFLPVLALACGTNDDMTTGESGGSGETGETGAGTTAAASTGDEPTTGEPDGSTGGTTGAGEGAWPDPEDAPSYEGDAFTGMQIYDVARELWLDEEALLTALDPVRVVYVGEQHEVAAIHELELWVLNKLLARRPDLALGMEQFQRDEQPAIDEYLAGEIDAATFEATAQPWENYAKYWKPLVEAMKAAGRPVLGLNVPDEALDELYSAFPMSPLSVFNSWGPDATYDAELPPRPLAMWTAEYQDYFAGSYDYEAHGKDWGLTYEEALAYFTDLALIRDDTMGWWISRHLADTEEPLLVVAGDWHVQTGLATPDSAAKFADDADSRRITTATPGTLAMVLAGAVGDRLAADFVLVYTPQ